MIALTLAALASVATPSHTVVLTHAGAPIALTYDARTAVAHRQIGSVAPPGAPTTLRCRWTAAVSVHRRAARDGADVPALARQVSTAKRLEGSRPGTCAQARASIAREVAARGGALGDHLADVAARDRPAVLAELESVGSLASRS